MHCPGTPPHLPEGHGGAAWGGSAAQTPVTFDDVAVHFSADEWAYLEGWQKDLHRDVMKDNLDLLKSVGIGHLKMIQDRCPTEQEFGCNNGNIKVDKLLGETLNTGRRHPGRPRRSHHSGHPPCVPPKAQKRVPRLDPKDESIRCSDCGVGFNCKARLIRHQMVHSDVRPFVCEVCDRTFNRKCHLISHLRTHRTDRPIRHWRPRVSTSGTPNAVATKAASPEEKPVGGERQIAAEAMLPEGPCPGVGEPKTIQCVTVEEVIPKEEPICCEPQFAAEPALPNGPCFGAYIHTESKPQHVLAEEAIVPEEPFSAPERAGPGPACTVHTGITEPSHQAFLDAMNQIVRSMDVRLEQMALSVACTQTTIITSLNSTMQAVESRLAAIQDSVQAMVHQLQELGQNQAGAAAGILQAGHQRLTPVPVTEAKTHTRLSGRVLPDFPLPSITTEQKREMKLKCHLRADIMARELFKHFVGFERYQQWAHNVNYDGTDDKTALPVNLRDAIMHIIEEQFAEDNFSKCRARINEFLRMPRKTQWRSVVKGPRRTLIPAPQERQPARLPATPPVATCRTGNANPFQEQSPLLPPVSSFCQPWCERHGGPQFTSTSLRVSSSSASPWSSSSSPPPDFTNL